MPFKSVSVIIFTLGDDDKLNRPATKKTRRRVLFVFSLTAIVLIVVASSLVKIWFQIIDKNNEQKFLLKELSGLQGKEQNLKVEVEKLQDPDYVARYAREKYLYSKDGEFTIRIP